MFRNSLNSGICTAFVDFRSRCAIEAGAADHGLAHIAGNALSESPLVPALVVAALLAGWALSDTRFGRPSGHLIWSLAVGAVIVFAWAATARIAAVGFDPVEVESFSFSAPVGQSLLYVMTAASSEPNFAIGAVAGVIAGAALGSLFKGKFRWEACDDARELRRQMLGAATMGIGGVVRRGAGSPITLAYPHISNVSIDPENES